MRHSRILRLAGHAVLLVLFVLATYGAVRFFLGTVTARGFDPGALFGLLLVLGTISLVWRSVGNVRRAYRRYRG
jgi:hypothetical protein